VEERGSWIDDKFFRSGRRLRLIIHAMFGDDRFRGVWSSGGGIVNFSIDLRCRPIYSGTTVPAAAAIPACDQRQYAQVRASETVSRHFLSESRPAVGKVCALAVAYCFKNSHDRTAGRICVRTLSWRKRDIYVVQMTCF